jgi:UDP-N-acetylmuramate--alanine ligase
MYRGKKSASIALKVPGKHNILNALAACAASAQAGAGWDAIEKGLNEYSGAGRRFEILGTFGGVTVADDYAHHPTEVKATLEAAKSLDYKKVWAVFQPFTYSRTVMLMQDFADVLKIADRVVLAEIMGSREVNTYNVYSKDLAAKVPGSVWFPTFREIADYVVKNAEPGDLVITLGCGDIYKAAKMMLGKA